MTRDNDNVTYVLKTVVNEAKFAAAAKRAAKALARDVVRIRYYFEDDWTGDPSIFFKIVLTDEASKLENLRAVSLRKRQSSRTKPSSIKWGFSAISISEVNPSTRR